MKNFVNESPDRIVEIAFRLKDEKKYDDSIELFRKAIHLFLIELDIQQNVRAFDCAHQIALIKVELSTIKSLFFEFGFSPNDTIIKELMFDFDKIENSIKERSNWEGKFINKSFHQVSGERIYPTKDTKPPIVRFFKCNSFDERFFERFFIFIFVFYLYYIISSVIVKTPYLL